MIIVEQDNFEGKPYYSKLILRFMEYRRNKKNIINDNIFQHQLKNAPKIKKHTACSLKLSMVHRVANRSPYVMIVELSATG